MGAGQALSAGGAGLQLIGSIQAGNAQAGSYRSQAKQSREAGRESLAMSNYKVRLIHEAGTETLGQIEAETGKAGLAMSGTPLKHLVQTARQVELTAAMQHRAGVVEKQRYDRQARALDEAAREAKRAGVLGGLGGAVSSLRGMF
jgi:hypothetical protein